MNKALEWLYSNSHLFKGPVEEPLFIRMDEAQEGKSPQQSPGRDGRFKRALCVSVWAQGWHGGFFARMPWQNGPQSKFCVWHILKFIYIFLSFKTIKRIVGFFFFNFFFLYFWNKKCMLHICSWKNKGCFI